MKIAAIALAVVAFGTAAPAGAATVVTRYEFLDSGLTTLPRNFNISGFDAALGTLEAVTLELTGVVQSQFLINNFTDESFTYETLTFGGAAVDFPGLSLRLDASNGAIDSTLVLSQSTQSRSVFVNVNGSSTTADTGVLSAFTGASGFVTGRYQPILGFRCEVCRDFSDVQLTGLTGHHELKVTFDYSPAMTAVPEPTTWAMLVAGLGLVGGMMRRRGRPAAALA